MSQKTFAWQHTLVLLAAVLGVAVTFSLGMWQISRGDDKLRLQKAKDQQAMLAPLDGRTLAQGQGALQSQAELL